MKCDHYVRLCIFIPSKELPLYIYISYIHNLDVMCIVHMSKMFIFYGHLTLCRFVDNIVTAKSFTTIIPNNV